MAGTALATLVIVYRLRRPESFERAVAGWASLMVAALLTAAVVLVFLGVIGEYAGRTYLSVCRKPQAAVREILGAEPDDGARGLTATTASNGEG
jgi:undecaprenyl-phosphate 4-deoxy-4-formamido-L-arabinose transferase